MNEIAKLFHLLNMINLMYKLNLVDEDLRMSAVRWLLEFKKLLDESKHDSMRRKI